MAKINYKKVAFHILAWAAVFFISTILIPGDSLRLGTANALVSWGLYVFIFYVNYLVLIPKLFNRRWMILYGVLALALLFGSFRYIRYTAMESARKSAVALGDRLQLYNDVKDSFEEKEGIRDLQRGIERRREWEKRSSGADAPPAEGPSVGGPPVDGRRGRNEEWPAFPPEWNRWLDELASMSDSMRTAYALQFERQQDSILMLDVSLTPREEGYGQRRLEFDRMRSYARFLSRSDSSPFSEHNLTFVFALIFFYMAAVIIYFTEQSAKTEKRRREEEQERTRAELAYLKQQINPHFLFNTLNAIYSYTIGVSDEASDAVLKLSSILRYMLYETHRDRVPLPDELAMMTDYIELQRLRTTEKTDIEVVVSGNPTPYRIEPMLLIPIIENAFKYGVDSVEPSFVRITIAIEGHRFTFRIANRVVRRREEDRDHSGIGIKNIRRRLELIYGPGNYELSAGEKDGIFTVTLQIDLKE